MEGWDHEVLLRWWARSGHDSEWMNGAADLSALGEAANSGWVWSGKSLKCQNYMIGYYFIDFVSHSITIQPLYLYFVPAPC